MEVLHLVSARWNGSTPQLTGVAADGRFHEIPLTGPFDWTISQSKTCVGSWKTGSYTPCLTDEPVHVHRQCQRCSPIEDLACIFEPRCKLDPSTCTCTFGAIPHVVYVAFYGILPKVGLTQEGRTQTRLREQGSDAWFLAARTPDRATARATERQIAFLHRIPEHRSYKQILPQLARPIPWPRIEERAQALAESLANQWPVESTLHRIEDYPIHLPLPARPRRRQAAGRHTGTWIGAKGRFLFYEAITGPANIDAGIGGPTQGIPLQDLAGRKLAIPSADEEPQ